MSLELFFAAEDAAVDGGVTSFLAASCAKKEAADAAVVLAVEDAADDAGTIFPVPPSTVLDRFVNAEFLNMLGVEARDEALLPLLPPLCTRSRSTSDELVAAAFGATVDADRPSPVK